MLVCVGPVLEGEGCMLPMRKASHRSVVRSSIGRGQRAYGGCGVRHSVRWSETEARAPDEVGKLVLRFIGWELLPQTLIYESCVDLNTTIAAFDIVTSFLHDIFDC